MISRPLLYFCLLLLCHSTTAQDKLQFSLSAGPQWSALSLSQDASRVNPDFTYSTKSQLGALAVADFRILLDENTHALRTGIRYRRARYMFRVDGLFFASDINQGGNIEKSSHIEATINRSAVCLHLGYQFLFGKQRNRSISLSYIAMRSIAKEPEKASLVETGIARMLNNSSEASLKWQHALELLFSHSLSLFGNSQFSLNAGVAFPLAANELYFIDNSTKVHPIDLYFLIGYSF